MKLALLALRPALAKLIRLLASDVDGEALAAVRALGRALKASGCDFHDLASIVEAPSTSARNDRAVAGFHNHFGGDDDGETKLPWQLMVDLHQPARSLHGKGTAVSPVDAALARHADIEPAQLAHRAVRTCARGGMTIWTAPSHLPDLSRVDNNIVAIDTEENDEGLRAGRGSGWPWHGGWICGISLAWREGGEIRAIYIPIRHPDTNNFDPATSPAGSRTTSQPASTSSPKTDSTIGAGCAPISASSCHRPISSTRSARWRP